MADEATAAEAAPKVTGGKRRQKGRAAVEKRANALSRLTVEYVPVESIRPNTYNPNRQDPHDFELLVKSMREDGFTQPIVLQADTNEIVDGEHRWRAAQELGLAEIPVVKVNMTAEQMRIATLRHNRARGNEDVELTAELLRDLQELGAIEWAQDSLMLDDAELDRMLNDVAAPEALAGEDFSEAWEPRKIDPEDVAPVREVTPDGEHRETALSAGAVEAQREQRRKLAEARTEQERETIKREAKIYRVVLVFAGDEADTVRAVLGDTPAESLLGLCRDRLAAGEPAAG